MDAAAVTWLRDATAEDSGALTALMLTSRAYAGAYRAIVADYPVTPDLIGAGITRVAESGTGIMGFYRLDVADAELDLMFVDDAVRGTGLGRVLFDDAVAAARAAGLRSVRIVAHPPAAGFYRRMGARDVGVVAPSGRAEWERPELSVATTWSATVLTLYPEMFPGPLGASLAGRALAGGVWRLDARNIRDFTTDRHRTVDDTPAGGGPGMVLRADVVAAALDAVGGVGPALALSPRGVPLTQARVRELAAGPGVRLVCGRFEGFDERLFAGRDVEAVSIGDYVLSGGEPAALVLLDACVRLLPGVMGASSSGSEESFESGLLEYPHYTRPAMWEGQSIPEVLRSGDHAKVAAWRQARSEEDTRLRRPDLWERHLGARVDPPSGARRKEDE